MTAFVILPSSSMQMLASTLLYGNTVNMLSNTLFSIHQPMIYSLNYSVMNKLPILINMQSEKRICRNRSQSASSSWRLAPFGAGDQMLHLFQ
jgi:hypothetical protein